MSNKFILDNIDQLLLPIEDSLKYYMIIVAQVIKKVKSIVKILSEIGASYQKRGEEIGLKKLWKH